MKAAYLKWEIDEVGSGEGQKINTDEIKRSGTK